MISDTTKKIRKITNRTLAIHIAVPSRLQKPRIAATRAMTRTRLASATFPVPHNMIHDLSSAVMA
jgi:hypothetical protein